MLPKYIQTYDKHPVVERSPHMWEIGIRFPIDIYERR